MSSNLLATLVPLRDAEERAIAFELRAAPASPPREVDIDREAEATLTLLADRTITRLAGRRSVHVPVTAGVLKRGLLTRFASYDVVFLLPVEALDDEPSRRAMERLTQYGARFGFVGDALPAPLPTGCERAPVAFEHGAGSGLELAVRVQRLRAAGAQPVARGIDDRVSRERAFAAGVTAVTGLPLPRGRRGDDSVGPRLVRALAALVPLADGRPADDRLDALVTDDPVLADALMRAATSASLGVRGRPTLTYALRLLGRERVIDRLVVACAFLLADAAGDPELPRQILERAEAMQRLGAALDTPVHPRARTLAALLASTPLAIGIDASTLSRTLALPPFLSDVLGDRVTPLGRLVDLVEAHEQGWWADVRSLAGELGLAPTVVTRAWQDGWRVAREELGALRPGVSARDRAE